MISLYPFQEDAIRAIWDRYWDGVTRPVVQIPTGGGKTRLAAAFTEQFLSDGRRFLFLVHRARILTQARDEFASHFGADQLGIVQAHQDAYAMRYVFASWATLNRPERLARYLSKGAPSLIITDEAHHVPAKSYLRTLEQLVGPETVTLGLSATPYRSDDLSLRVWFQELVYSISILELISLDVLSDIRRLSITTDLDLSQVSTDRNDEYNEKQLAQAVAKSGNRYQLILQALLHPKMCHEGIPFQGIFFGASVDDAKAFTDIANEHGVSTALIVDKTPEEERERAYAAFEAGDLRYLACKDVLTEGYNFPNARVAIVARHTKSQALYLQIIGRVCRKAEGKPFGIVLDIADNKHSVLTLPDLIGTTERAMGTKSVREVLKERQLWVPDDTKPVATGTDVYYHPNSLFTRDPRWRKTAAGYQLSDPTGRIEVTSDIAGFSVSFTSVGGQKLHLAPGRYSKTIATDIDKAFAFGEQHLLTLKAKSQQVQARREDHTRARPEQITKLRGLYPAWQGMSVAQVQKAWDEIKTAKAQGVTWWKSSFNTRAPKAKSPATTGKTRKRSVRNEESEWL